MRPRLPAARVRRTQDQRAHQPESPTITDAEPPPGGSRLKRLRVAGLIHRWNDLVSASRPAVRFHEITQSVDPDSEHERHHERSVLELLLSDADENRPLSEKQITRALGASKKGRKLDVIDALDRLDGAGLVDRRAGLAVASEAARRFDQVIAL